MPKTAAIRSPVHPERHRKHHRHERKPHETDNEAIEAHQEAVASGERERSPKTSKRTLFSIGAVSPETSNSSSPEAHDLEPPHEDAKPLAEARRKLKLPTRGKSRAAAIIHRGFVGLGHFGGKRTKHREDEEEENVELPGLKGMPMSFLVFIIVVVLVVAGFFATLLVKFFKDAVFPKKPEAYNCSSGYCLTYGRFLVEGVRDDVHPCDDFYQHVCGKWDANRAVSFMEYAREQFSRAVAQAARAVEVPRRAQTPAQKAAQFFKSCDNILDQDQTSEVIRLLKEGGLSWPHDSSDPDILRAIFYTSMTLHLPAVIHVTVKNAGEHRLNLHLRRAGTFEALAKKQDKLAKLGKFERYIEALISSFSDRNKSLPKIQDTIQYERMITPVLLSHFNDRQPLSVSVELLQSVSKGTFKQTWHKAIRTYIPKAQNSDAISVTISYDSFFETFCNLTQSYGEAIMHRYISWYAVQDIAKFANLQLAINHYGSEKLATDLHPVQCAILTEETLGVPFMVPHLRKSLYPEGYQKIYSMAERLVLITNENLTPKQKQACRLASSQSTALNRTKESFKGDVTKFIDFQYSNDNFEGIPDLTETFLSNWILVNKARDSEKMHGITLTVRILLNAITLIDSVFYGTSVSLPPWVLLPPVFAPGWSAGFQYGGLGGEIATALIACALHRPLDDRLLTGAGKTPDSVLKASNSNSESCPFSNIDILSRSLESALSGNASADDDYKRMFVQWCYVRCGRKMGADICNQPLRDSALFSRSFTCSDGSYMKFPRNQ